MFRSNEYQCVLLAGRIDRMADTFNGSVEQDSFSQCLLSFALVMALVNVTSCRNPVKEILEFALDL